MKKATKRQVKRHNQQLVLRAIYSGIADNRAALARETNLSKPTISSIVTELIDAGFVGEGGRGDSTSSGGKRATLLNFIPTAQQLIAITVDAERITGCLSYLDGTIVARHLLELHPQDDVFQQLQFAINGMIAQIDAPLMCISVGAPGKIDSDTGTVISSSTLGWENVPLADELEQIFDVPIVIGNNTDFATRARFTANETPKSLVTLFVGDTIEIGSTIDGSAYQVGNDLALLPTPNGTVEQLTWMMVKQRVQALLQDYPDSILNTDKLTYLHIKQAILLEDAAAQHLLEDISSTLAHVYVWIIALMKPSQIVLAGTMSHMGQTLLDAIYQKLSPPFQQTAPEFVLSQDSDLTLQGAIASALQKELGIV